MSISLNRTKKYTKVAWKKIRHQLKSFVFEKTGYFQPSPLKVYYTMTNRCNFRCAMCPHWRWAENDKDEDYISTERMKEIINEMAVLGIGEIGFSGGEPLLFREKLFSLLDHANKKGIYTHFVTNCSLLTLEDIQCYDQIGGGHISISIDGMGELHDQLRGFAGAYSGVAKVLEIFRTNKFENINLKINTVLSDKNLDNILEIARAAIDINAMFFVQPYDLYDFHGQYDAQAREEKFPLWIKKENFQKLEELIKALLALKEKYPHIIMNDKKHLLAMLPYFTGGAQKIKCLSGIDQFTVNQNGQVYFCKYKVIGDLKKEGLKTYLKSDKYRKIIKDSLKCQAGCMLGCQFRPGLGELLLNGPRQFYKLIKK